MSNLTRILVLVKVPYVVAMIVLVAWCASRTFAQVGMPTPHLTEAEALRQCNVAAEGQITAVTLVKRWVGTDQGDLGYEQGIFKCSLLVEKPLKGNCRKGQTLEYVVHAYMEGKWDKPRLRFEYEGTHAAVIPGSKLRVYLTWDREKQQYERVHFNSGFEIEAESTERFPHKVGETVYAPNAKKPDAKDPKATDKKAEPESGTVDFYVIHDGKTMIVAANKEIIIRLGSTMDGSGSHWDVGQITGEAVKSEGKPTYVNAQDNPPGLEGAGDFHVIKLRALKPGKSIVTLDWYPSEKAKPEHAFTVTIEVQ